MSLEKVKIRTYVKRDSGEKKVIAMVNEFGCLQSLNFKDEEFSVKKIFLPVEPEQFALIFSNLSKNNDLIGALCRQCARERIPKSKMLNCQKCQLKNGGLEDLPIDGIVIFKISEGKSKNRKILFFYRTGDKKDLPTN